VLVLLALDLGVFHRHAHAVSIREATVWTVVWIALALAFNYSFYRYALAQFPENPSVASRVGLEFLTGYVVEKTLSLDNIFVFVVIFGFFAVPAQYQHRILFYGVAGALVFRAIFIALGAALLDYAWVMLLFGIFLILTGIKVALAPDRPLQPDKNPVIRLLRRVLPVTDSLHGGRFLVRIGGVLHATPLLLVLALVEFSDILFAVDSVPAIFAITKEPLIVFTSNVFAILGLRSLYFLLAGAVGRFYLLKYGVGAVLVFVGLKMVWLNEAFEGHFPPGWSLGIILVLLGAPIAASLAFPRRTAVPS